MSEVEDPTTGGRIGQSRVKSGDNYSEYIGVGTSLLLFSPVSVLYNMTKI